MNARTFGTDAKYQASLERHNAKYGTDDPQVQGQMIIDAQREANARREQGISTERLHGVEGVAREPQSRVFVDAPSDKAVDYLVSLWMERSNKATEEQVRTWAQQQDRRVVSDKIDWLKTQPKLAATRSTGGSLERHNVPAGRYAVTGNEGQTVFVKVDRPTDGKWAGRIFVKIQAGDELIRTERKTADALLGKIAADGVQDAMLRYGREIGSCGHCGRTLTNEESRQAGIGPVCRGKMGW